MSLGDVRIIMFYGGLNNFNVPYSVKFITILFPVSANHQEAKAIELIQYFINFGEMP